MQNNRGRVYAYENKNGTWRVEIRRPGCKRTTQTFATESEARAVAAHARAQFEGCEKSVSQAIEAYLLDKERHGLKASTIRTARYQLASMFPDADMPLPELHKWSAADLYRDLVDRSSSVSTHRNTLNEARRLGKWLQAQGWLAANPFAGVQGVGKRKRRKPQLTIDESRTLAAYCLGDPSPGATATLCCLLLAMRAGEVARISARDIDDGGRVLWVLEAKTEAGERCLEVPDVLQKRLPTLAALDVDRHWVSYHVRRCCKAAGVLVVGPHSLRGTHASLATSAGATSQLVAATLGHASTGVTEAHYTEPSALHGSKQRAALRVLAGGAKLSHDLSHAKQNPRSWNSEGFKIACVNRTLESCEEGDSNPHRSPH